MALGIPSNVISAAPRDTAALRAGGVPPKRAKALDRILHLLWKTTHVDFRLYKEPSITRKIRQRMLLQGVPDLDQYARYLAQHPAEVHDLFESALIRGTGFFREPKSLQALHARVFPQLISDARKTTSIRIWVPGCSTGEEVYSLAIVLLEFLGDQPVRPKIQFFGTDLSGAAIQTARTGLYTNAALKPVSTERRRRFFVKHQRGYQIATWVRDLCVFGRHDLSADPYFARMDLISCQNVLNYFESALQERIIAGLHHALSPTGFLVLGKMDASADYGDLFAVENARYKILSPKPNPARSFATTPTLALEGLRTRELAAASASATANLIDKARGLLVGHYSPPALVVDFNLNIVHFQGDTGPFLRPGTGTPSFHLLKMLRPEFVLDVRSLIYQARKAGKPTRLEGIHVDGGEPTQLALEVIPLDDTNPRERSFVVVFQRTPSLPQPDVSDEPQREPSRSDLREIESLRNELAATKACLKLIAEEQDTVNAELGTANEEIASDNAELSRANAALSAAKQETQVLNEKLKTLNEELRNRNAELTTLADDVSGLLTGSNVPILILDNDRRIRRFTPAAQRVLELKSADIGRSFLEILSSIAGEELSELLSQVTDKLQTIEKDISLGNGRWYSLRMRPYRISSSKSTGIIMTLMDVDRLKGLLRDAEGNLKATQNLYRLLADSTNDLVALHGRDTKYIYISPSCERLLGYNNQEILRKSPTEFCHPDDLRIVSLVFEKVARTGKPCQCTYRVLAKTGKVSWLEVLISPIKDNYGAVTSFQSSSREVTERKRADDKLRESEFTVRTLMESTSQGILAVNRAGKIVLSNLMAASMFGYTKADFIGKPILDLIPRESRRQHEKRHLKFFQKPTRRPMDVALDLSGLHKSGREFPVEISLSSILVNHETLAVAFVTDVSKRKQAEAALQESHDKLLALSSSLMTAHDEASRRLSRELHDVFSQELAALTTESRLLKADLPRHDTATAHKAERLAKRIAKLAKDMHHMSRRLHPAVLDELGLQAALRAECHAFSQLHGIATVFTSKRAVRSLPPDIALCLYRVTQESLRNVAKHSGTKTVSVDLAVKKGELHLKIADFGRGFDSRAHTRKSMGLGLISMRERIRACGGTLAVDSELGKGTTVLARVPLRVAQ